MQADILNDFGLVCRWGPPLPMSQPDSSTPRHSAD